LHAVPRVTSFVSSPETIATGHRTRRERERTASLVTALFRVLSNPSLSSVPACSTVIRADKGKLTERWGRKASGLRTSGL
jgi:hypothetical protein